jgi:hypothetical protein
MKKIFAMLFTMLAVGVATAQNDTRPAGDNTSQINTIPQRTGVTSSLKQTDNSTTAQDTAQPGNTGTRKQARKGGTQPSTVNGNSQSRTSTTTTTKNSSSMDAKSNSTNKSDGSQTGTGTGTGTGSGTTRTPK